MAMVEPGATGDSLHLLMQERSFGGGGGSGGTSADEGEPDDASQTCSWDYWSGPSVAKTRKEAFDELIEAGSDIIDYKENCSAIVTTGCAVAQLSLNNANSCVNCPLNHTVCACNKCTLYGPNCERYHGTCKPRLVDYLIITKCKYDSCADKELQQYTHTVLSVGCYCDVPQFNAKIEN